MLSTIFFIDDIKVNDYVKTSTKESTMFSVLLDMLIQHIASQNVFVAFLLTFASIVGAIVAVVLFCNLVFPFLYAFYILIRGIIGVFDNNTYYHDNDGNLIYSVNKDGTKIQMYNHYKIKDIIK